MITVRIVLCASVLAACGAPPRPVAAPPVEGGEDRPPPAEMRPLTAGATAPEFALPDATGQVRTLAELHVTGPVVVLFYQGAWCGACRTQLARFEAKQAAFHDLGATIVAVSRDHASKSRRLAEAIHLTYPLLTDSDLEVANRFGVTQSVGGLALAAVFVVDTQGNVVWSQVGETVSEDMALDQVRALARPKS